MAEYTSKPTTVEAMQWTTGHNCTHGQDFIPKRIVAWVNDNGGEAQPARSVEFGPAGFDYRPARIAIRTINGWAYAKPGDYVVKGGAVFKPYGDEVDEQGRPTVRSGHAYVDFHPVNSASFEKRWALKAGDPQ